QGFDDLAVRGPVAGGLAEGGVDDELVGVLTDGEDVLKETEQAFLAPAFGAELGAGGDGEVGVAGVFAEHENVLVHHEQGRTGRGAGRYEPGLVGNGLPRISRQYSSATSASISTGSELPT